jgi:hypothetical protein
VPRADDFSGGRCAILDPGTRARLLEAAAGEVREQHSLDLSTRLEDFRGSPVYEALGTIHRALQEHRGFETFVGKPRLRGADYFLTEERVAVEFDESQHFTAPRRLSLALYPPDLALGFDRSRWMDLCARLNRRDHSPPYRDEQRAWLDVLRDVSAVVLGNRPTVRVYAGDGRWCALDPARADDVEAFARRYLPGIGPSGSA